MQLDDEFKVLDDRNKFLFEKQIKLVMHPRAEEGKCILLNYCAQKNWVFKNNGKKLFEKIPIKKYLKNNGQNIFEK